MHHGGDAATELHHQCVEIHGKHGIRRKNADIGAAELANTLETALAQRLPQSGPQTALDAVALRRIAKLFRHDQPKSQRRRLLGTRQRLLVTQIAENSLHPAEFGLDPAAAPQRLILGLAGQPAEQGRAIATRPTFSM